MSNHGSRPELKRLHRGGGHKDAVRRFNQYFHGNAGLYSRLIALRFAMFGLIVIYCCDHYVPPHASRYGAGNFNVAQIGLLISFYPCLRQALSV